MLFWFVGASVLIIWFVFTDPDFDYRLLPVGALLPGVIGLIGGAARVAQSLTVSAVLLIVVVLATKRHSARRRFWMGLPLGTLLYLVLSGAWADGRVFWWPFFGFDLGAAAHPVLSRGWWNLLLELLGVAMCWWIWTRAGLGAASRRREFAQTGRLRLPER